jgi:hypothetical protein
MLSAALNKKKLFLERCLSAGMSTCALTSTRTVERIVFIFSASNISRGPVKTNFEGKGSETEHFGFLENRSNDSEGISVIYGDYLTK